MEKQNQSISTASLKSKVDTWLNAFYSEAQLYELANTHEEFWKDYKEEPLLTLLATGLARRDSLNEVSIVREYPVYKNGRRKGRSDLFLNYYKEKEHFYFEAKFEKATHETGFLEWLPISLADYFGNIENQLLRYVHCEIDASAKSYLVSFLFHVVDFSSESMFSKYQEGFDIFHPEDGQFYLAATIDNPSGSSYGKFGVIEITGFVKNYKEITMSLDDSPNIALPKVGLTTMG